MPDHKVSGSDIGDGSEFVPDDTYSCVYINIRLAVPVCVNVDMGFSVPYIVNVQVRDIVAVGVNIEVWPAVASCIYVNIRRTALSAPLPYIISGLDMMGVELLNRLTHPARRIHPENTTLTRI